VGGIGTPFELRQHQPRQAAGTIAVPAAWKIHAALAGMLAAPEAGRTPG